MGSVNPTELVFNLGGANGSPTQIDLAFGGTFAGAQIQINVGNANGGRGESIGINIVA